MTARRKSVPMVTHVDHDGDGRFSICLEWEHDVAPSRWFAIAMVQWRRQR